MLNGLNQRTSVNKSPGSPQVLLMAASLHKEDPCLGEEKCRPSSDLAFLPLFCSPPGLRPCVREPWSPLPVTYSWCLEPPRTSWLQMPCAAGRPSPLSWPPASSSSPWESLWVSGHGALPACACFSTSFQHYFPKRLLLTTQPHYGNLT